MKLKHLPIVGQHIGNVPIAVHSKLVPHEFNVMQLRVDADVASNDADAEL